MHRFLRLQHHKHTGKVLHHRHTSYRALALLLLATGLVMVKVEMSLRQMAAADTLYVYATVPAQIPTAAAVILQPVDGSTTSNSSVTVSGTCPVTSPPVTVAIYDNGNLMGSAPCTSSTFNLIITLVTGSNRLLARTYTITGDSGPDSAVVHVTYTPPILPVNPGNGNSAGPSANSQNTGNSSGNSGQPTSSGLIIVSDKPFISFGPGQTAEWIGHISGGTTPYTVTIRWGDNTTSVYRSVNGDTQHFKHGYTLYVPHVLRIGATDKHNAQASSMFAAVSPYVPPVIGNILAGTPRNGGISNNVLFSLYGAYLLLLSLFGMIWLRSHRQYVLIPIANKRPLPAAKRRPSQANRSTRRRR